MSSFSVLSLLLFLLVGVHADESTSASTTATTTSTTTTTATSALTNEKIARRIIEERLTPPRATDFAPWNTKRQLPVGEVYHGGSPPSVTEELDDNVTEKAVPKKAVPKRTVEPSQEPGCCGNDAKSVNSNDKEKSPNQEALNLERGNGAAGPAPRFHGNGPSDDRYGGWKSSSYLGYGLNNKNKGYYDQRNHYAYDRYSSAPRPTSQGYATDGDRYGTLQRPGSAYGTDNDKYSPVGTTRPGSNFQSANYGFGPAGSYGDRPRPGIGGGAGGNVEGDADYPYPEGGPSNGLPPGHLQTQKAVALKALAGVALIGAAAALASNPVLLPISVISGRRKRSAIIESNNYALTALLQGYIQPKTNEVERKDKSESNSTIISAQEELVISPHCVARLACHVHRDYLDELEKSKAELLSAAADEATLRGLEHWFDSLVHSSILGANYLSDELKLLIKSAVAVGSNKNASCDEFSCLNLNNSTNNKTS